MTATLLEKLFEHNNWANMEILNACLSLPDEQLDAQPVSATKGTIRETIRHLVEAQEGYLSDLLGKDVESHWESVPPLEELVRSAAATGEQLIALAHDPNRSWVGAEMQTRDGEYRLEPWVLALQIINHGTEHREQVKNMLSILGVVPPRIDGWVYGRLDGAMVRSGR